MGEMAEVGQAVLMWLGMGGVVVLCLVGALLSALSLSGTWFVVAATALAGVLRWGRFPGLWTVAVFVLICAGVEVVEAFAGSWGVMRRGGSRLAGVAALAGGLLGLVFGSLLPIPVLGSLLGMVAGSFVFVFAVESHRLKSTGRAADVAWGAVAARLAMLFLKVVVTLGMTGVLFAGMLGGF